MCCVAFFVKWGYNTLPYSENTDLRCRFYAESEFEEYCHYCPRWPRKNHSGGRNAETIRRLPGEPGGCGAGYGLQRLGAWARHYHHGQEHRRTVRGRKDQHCGYAGPCRLWRRGRTYFEDGQRRYPSGGCSRGPHAPDPVCAV